MKLRITSLLLLCCVGTLISAQTTHKTFTDPANLRGERVKPRDGRELPVDQGAAGLQQLLRKLNTRASIMNIVAHPDDEDGGMLTLYSRGVGARVADLSLTRGEGGQNAMTGDFEDALGLLRTQELLACDRYSGIDQFFGTEVDFGFSKTKEEAFSKWTHDRVLYDVVRAVRLYRPLVLTATFIGGVTDGHGQHQVSGQIAQEVFKAAGDPKIFPELTAEGILPWQPLKVYARVPTQSISDKGLFDYATGQYTQPRFENYVSGDVTTTPPSVDVVVHEGEPDPLLKDAEGKPLSYVQFARMGLAMQKSQTGPGMRAPQPGRFDVSYHLYGSRVAPETKKPEDASFFDGIDTSIGGIAVLAPHATAALRTELDDLGAIFTQAQKQTQAGKLQQVAASLLKANTQIDCIESTLVDPRPAGALGCRLPHPEQYAGIPKEELDEILHELNVKRVQVDEALPLAMGITMDAEAASDEGAVIAGRPLTIAVHLITPSEDANPSGVKLEGTWVASTRTHKATTMGIAWDYTFNVLSPEINRFPATAPYFTRSTIEQPVYDLLDPALRNAPQTPAPLVVSASFCPNNHCFTLSRIVQGRDTPQALRFVPDRNTSLSSHAQIVPLSQPAFTVVANVSPHFHTLLVGPDGPLELDTNSSSRSLTFTGKLPPHPRGSFVVTAVDNTSASPAKALLGYRSIGYGDLPRTSFYTPATDRIVPVDLKLPQHCRIGYLPGTGDAVPEALASIGLKPETLTVADLTADKLKPFDTVILGVRTYAAHSDLHGAPTKALLDYARGGGNVVVQYQTAEFTGDDAPYPLTLGRDAEKVVDETDAVRLLDANAPLLSVPDRIAPADFDHWVEERGHGFLRTWDAHYTALTETHDPGQEPQQGGLVTTQLGAGRWTYCAFAIYRQLPEAVPGAYRVFVNLLTK